MTDPVEEVRKTFVDAEIVGSESLQVSAHRREGASPPVPEEETFTILPRDFPVQPLGQADGKFYFLTTRGELTELSAGATNNRANLVAMFSGRGDAIEQLAVIAPPGTKDKGFCPATAADTLMQYCSELPIYDANTKMRYFGVWRGKSAQPVVHLGETILSSRHEDRRGHMISGVLYPAKPTRAAPADEIASPEDLEWVRERIQRQWSWMGEDDAHLLLGWIGQAVLGQYPTWRTHIYVKGRHGSGKSTLTGVVDALLGGMSDGVKNSTSAAAMRQNTNRMAICRVFDEAEADDDGNVSDVIALFRYMSDQEGAQVERGTSDHSGIKFQLYGSGYLASIIPAPMTAADKSRFVILSLGKRDTSADPADQAMYLAELEQDAKELGPKVWRRMLDLAPDRWDVTFRIYSSLVQGLGASSRTGDTIGAVLAGWDLMFHDEPLVNPDTNDADRARLERAKALALPLVNVAQEAEGEGDGDRCLSTIFSGILHKDHGGIITVAECIETIMDNQGEPEGSYNKLIQRLGLRLLHGDAGQHDLFIANGRNPLLDKALANTGWRQGGHKAALETIEEIKPSPKPIRVAGRPMRGVIVPARFLPGFKAKPDRADEGEE